MAELKVEQQTHHESAASNEVAKDALIQSFVKLHPKNMVKNPVMFVVVVGFVLTLLYAILEGNSVMPYWYTISVGAILFATVLFANFAEAIAEGRGKAQAESLRGAKQDLKANVIDASGAISAVSATDLRKGDVVLVRTGEFVPSDGEIIAGMAMIDESAITGESAPVMKEAGGDFSSVTGGTLVVSDEITVRITTNPGESFIDKMIALVEGASRQKTPNEMALNTVLISLTLIFLLVVVTLPIFTNYLGFTIEIPVLISLLVCLIPTTIGGLLSAIGIAGMDRVTKFNVIAKSGKAVEAAGDIHTIILDKTGTITFGNRMAHAFMPLDGVKIEEMRYWAYVSSVADETPEGRSIVALAEREGVVKGDAIVGDAILFQAETRMSGIDVTDGPSVRKGATSNVIAWSKADESTRKVRQLVHLSEQIAREGGTPLAVAVNDTLYGVIYLKDTVKPGMRERFDELRRMGIRTIMCTGDNPLTAATIAKEAGVDEFVAECKPEDKIEVIRREQASGKLVAMAGDGTNDAPALAQADVGLAMNSGTQAAKEAANMIDLDSDPTKIIEVVAIGKQLLMTRGALTTFSIANDIAKYFAILPAMFMVAIPELAVLNVMGLASPESAILSALIFNAVIIPLLIPFAMRGVKYSPRPADALLRRNLFIYGFGGVVVPFLGIKMIDLVLNVLL
ncbi:MAG: potassium-transporting ATPase subunit KdpB [Bacilli bacterium]